MLQIPVAKVAVLAATFAFDRPYTYKIPQPLTDTLRPGCRVMVPFSRVAIMVTYLFAQSLIVFGFVG